MPLSISGFGHVDMNSNNDQSDNEADEVRSDQVSDRTLRLFDAAARLGSFSGAARDIGVGQPAVSHAVARLESWIGGAVFVRSSAGVRLTALGRRLHDPIRTSFSQIDAAMSAAAGRTSSVTLSVSTSLASYWLMPRLAAFKRAHPGVELRVLTCDSDRDVGLDDADLWVPLGVVDRPGLVEIELCAERVVPVCTPPLATPSLTADLPGSVLAAPLIHLEERYTSRFDWPRWLRAHDVETQVDSARLEAYRSNDYSLVLQAAIAGDGVALGWMHIVNDLIESGRLVALGAPVETDQPFMILRRAGSVREPVAALQEWLRATMMASLGTS
jgi:DNA-binding transcriptional LysR family regulator